MNEDTVKAGMKKPHLTIGCISFIVIGLMLTGITDARIDPESVVGIWLFEDGDVVEDSSGNDNDGELVGGPKWTDEGKFGGGLEVQNNHVKVPITVDYDEITVMTWFNLGAGNVRPRFVGNDHTDVTLKGFQLMYNTATTNSFFDVGTGAQRRAAQFNFTADPGEWYHYAGTYDGSTVRAYMDGELMAESACEGAIADSGIDVLIGLRPGGDQFNGILDEVAIFNKALDQDDIKAIMEQGLNKVLATAVEPSRKLTNTWGRIKSYH